MASLAAPLLFGRDADLAKCVALFSGGARLVTITGAAGIGKSALARAVLARLPNGDDACVVTLADARDRAGALRRITRAANLGATTRADSVAAALAKTSPRLLVLDDADPVLAAIAPFARACLDGGAAITLIVTSREALGIDGEHVVALDPLEKNAAIALFRARAEGPVDDEAAAEIAALLEGIPLAIELAGGRTKLMSARELVDRKEERLRLLRSERRDIPERQRTLELAIDWTLSLATDDERRAFVALGVFEGPCALESFEEVVGPLVTTDAIDVAQALLRKSLIVRAASGGATRISMLATIRAFSRTIRDHDETRARAQAAHAHYYVALAERLALETYGARAEGALLSLEDALAELFVAFERERVRTPAVAARIAVALSDVFLFREACDLRTTFFDEAILAADHADVPALRVRTRVLHAKVFLELARAADARAVLERAVAIAEAANDADALADANKSLGWAALALGDAEGARAALEQALSHYVAHGDARGRADVLAALGVLSSMSGAVAEGHTAFAAAHDIHVSAGDTIRREKLEEIATLFGAKLTTAPVEAAALVEKLRASSEKKRAQGRTLREAIDLVHLAALESKSVSPSAGALVVGAEARFFIAPNSERVDLTRHGALRLVLKALFEAHLASTNGALSADALLAAGWPGEKIRYDAGMLRVYTAIRRLRKMGLEHVLITRDDGYAIDEAVNVTRG